MSGKAFINSITHDANELDESGKVVSGDVPTDFVLCVDGTGNDMPNEPREKNTNVTRIVDLLIPGKQREKNKEREITVAYQRGIGNDGIEQMNMNKNRNVRSLNNLRSRFRSTESIPSPTTETAAPSPTTETPTPSQITEKATESLIIEMVAINYIYISTCMRPERGDKLFIFGCGLGASASQFAAALVADWGIFDTDKYLENYEHEDYVPIIKTIVNTWVRRKGKKPNAQGSFNKPPKYFDCFTTVEIAYLGLIDRVASIEKSDSKIVDFSCKKLEFATGIENRPAILKARHAVALSEYRLKSILWNIDDVEQVQRVLELGFPGYNASICGGGGTKHQGIIIDWMVAVWITSECTDLLYAIDKREVQKLIETELNLPRVKVLRRKKEDGDPTPIPGSENEDQESERTESERTEVKHWDEEIGDYIIDGPPLPKGTGKHYGEPISEGGPAAPKGTGNHYRTEFGKHATQKLHRICEQRMWDVLCPHKMPVLGREKDGKPVFVWTRQRKWKFTLPLLADIERSEWEDKKKFSSAQKSAKTKTKTTKKDTFGLEHKSEKTDMLERKTFGFAQDFEIEFINLMRRALKKTGKVEWSPPRANGREAAKILDRQTR